MDSKPRLSTAWLIKVPEDKRTEVASSISQSTVVLRQLKLFIEHELAALDCPPTADYETPSWSHKQADRLGQMRALRRVLALVP